MLETIDSIVYGRILVGFGLAVLAFQLVVLVMAARRRGRAPLAPKLHAIAGAAIAVLAVGVGLSVHAARRMMLDAFLRAGDPTVKVTSVHEGLAGQTNAIPFAVSVIGMALLLWFVGLAFTLSAPQQDGRARSLPPAALVGAGLLPIAYGALQWSTSLIKKFVSLANAPDDERVVVIGRTLDEARAQFEHSARISKFAIPILAVVAVVLIVLRDRNPETAARRPAGRTTLAATATALVLGALLVVQARPMASENDMPWPPPSVGDHPARIDPPTPDLVGPDPIERAPIVRVYPDGFVLDSTKMNLDSLEWTLGTLRTNYEVLHSGATFNEIALIVADPATPIPRLLSVLGAIRGAEYRKPLFMFTKAEILMRPVLGKLQRIDASGAQVRLVYDDGESEYDDDEDAAPWKDAVTLRPQDFPAYDAFARRLVELRRDGKRVVVKLDRARR